MTAVAYLISDKYKALTVDAVVKIEDEKETYFRYQSKIELLEQSDFAVTVIGNEIVLTAIALLNSWYIQKEKSLSYTEFKFIDELTIVCNYLAEAYKNSGVEISKQGATLYFISPTKAFTWSLHRKSNGSFYSKQLRPINLLNGIGAVVYGGIGPLCFDLPSIDVLTDPQSIHDLLKKKIEGTHEEFRLKKKSGDKGFLDYEFEGFFSTVIFDSQTSKRKSFGPFENMSDQIYGLIQGAKNNQFVLSKTDSKWSPS
jgi:hypothetical protein